MPWGCQPIRDVVEKSKSLRPLWLSSFNALLTEFKAGLSRKLSSSMGKGKRRQLSGQLFKERTSQKLYENKTNTLTYPHHTKHLTLTHATGI